MLNIGSVLTPKTAQPQSVLTLDPAKYVQQNIQGGAAANDLPTSGGDNKDGLLKFLKALFAGG